MTVMKLRVLIADDEPLSRLRLRQFLQMDPDAELVAECSTGLETIARIRETSPDLVLLDVTMPGLDGLEVARSLHGAHRPAIIFVTAYDRFGVQAFEANAVDYLLKPFDQTRFQTACQRARKWLTRTEHAPAAVTPPNPPTEIDSGQVQSPFHSHSHSHPERISVRSDGRIVVLKIEEIDWVRAADNYVELHVGRATHLLRTPLTVLASRLPPTRFARISRSHLVNINCIKEIRSRTHGDFLVALRDGTALPGTRNYRHRVAGFLGEGF